eukprot:scaffold20180_cov28-Tisochrysis_lutea.AAC.2
MPIAPPFAALPSRLHFPAAHAGHHRYLGHCRQAWLDQRRFRGRALRDAERWPSAHGHWPRLWQDARARRRPRRRVLTAPRLPHREGASASHPNPPPAAYRPPLTAPTQTVHRREASSSLSRATRT